MEEKVIIKGERCDGKKFSILICLVITIIVTLLLLSVIYLPIYIKWYNYEKNGSVKEAMECASEICANILRWTIFASIVVSVVLIVIFFLFYKRMNIIVTDKRVYGTASFGRQVDLPIDSISSVGSAWFKGISVATSSERIAFRWIKNARKIHERIRDLLMIRQEKKEQAAISSENTCVKNADDLIKYKELLDGGIITQEEFDAKKKQLLGL